MRKLVRVGALFLLVLTARAEVQVGDRYEKVIAEKGPPLSKMETGAIQILSYADLSVRLEKGTVVTLGVPPPRRTAPRASEAKPSPPKTRAPVAPAAAATSAAWTTDLREALLQGKEQNRHVLLLFTGSDWCSWCHRLSDEILKTPEFIRYAAEHLILVELDFPKTLPQSAELRAQNAAVSRHFRIEAFPTVIVLDPTGKPVAKLGYQKGGPGPFVEALSQL